jgi:hypothetical protein
MAEPLVIELAENIPTIVATGVTSGNISRHYYKNRNLFYYSTYRLTAQPAPNLAEMKLEMVRMFQDDPENEEIGHSEPIDVYVLATLENGDVDTGTVVVAM